MTTLGKIFVIVNLVFSLVTAGLIVMVFAARTNWYDAYTKSQTYIKVAQANADTYQQEVVEARKRSAEDIKKLNDEIVSIRSERDRAEKARQDRVAELDKMKQLLNSQGVNVTGITEELKRRADEINSLKAFVDERDKRLLDVEKEKKDFRDRAIKAELDFKSEHERNSNLLAQLEAVSKEMARYQANGGAGAGKQGGTERRPPPEDVEGLVTDADPQTGYLTLSIGSDAGLTRGNTLEVYRLDPPTYLGTVQILEVRPDKAVAKPISAKGRNQIKVGDRVASTILSKR